jgi:hypothetical protein
VEVLKVRLDPSLADYEECVADLRAAAERIEARTGAVLPLRADIHLSVLNNSYDRLYLSARSVEMGT